MPEPIGRFSTSNKGAIEFKSIGSELMGDPQLWGQCGLLEKELWIRPLFSSDKEFASLNISNISETFSIFQLLISWSNRDSLNMWDIFTAADTFQSRMG